MLAVQKIILQGSSAMVTIPRAAMHFLKWRPGNLVVLTLNEDRSIHIELWRQSDFAQHATPGVIQLPLPAEPK